MKEYTVNYKLTGYGYIKVTAKDEDDAMDEINSVFCGDKPKHDENSWIDNEVLYDTEWDTEVTSVEED